MLEHAFNELEPPSLEDCPKRLCYGDQEYRRRPAAPNTVATSFGSIVLRRYRYEPLEAGEKSIFPLERQLGIEAGLATPALAEQVGLWAVDHEQRQVLALLERHCDVRWSVSSLRKLTAALSDGMASFRHEAQLQRVLEWLAKAHKSRGPHQPVLAAGRDGVMVPIRQQGNQEAAVATVSVYNRRGKRLGTIYVGHMPQPGQTELSARLTALLDDVLRQWQRRGGKAPRLAYITDKGHHQQDYYHRVLRKMADPWQPGRKLVWEWVLDYFHVVGYVWKMAEALFGDEAARWKWFKKMRRWLRHRPEGVANILRSAMQRLDREPMKGQRETNFWDAYRYLRSNSRCMNYAAYRREGLPIGSGVTEAACKTVFSQRLKRSGMSWDKVGGQVIVELRVIRISGVWREVHQAYLGSGGIAPTASGGTFVWQNVKNAA